LGVFFYKGAPGEDVGPARVRFGAKRTVICSLILTALSWMLAQGLSSRIEWGWGLWAILVWAVVVSVYAIYTYMGVRQWVAGRVAGPGLSDPLTGLPNRKGLVTALEAFSSDVEEFGRRVRLIDVDLINLNKVNYEYGQMIGDVVLQDVADLLRRTAREQDIVGRLGGDEFLVVLPSSTTEEAEGVALALEDAIEQYKLNLGERGEVSGLKGRVSVAAYMPDQASLHETVVRAKEQTAHGKLPEATGGEEETFYHVPRVTLGAFAVQRWQTLSQDDRNSYKKWQRELDSEFTDRMATDIVRMLDEKAETHWADFVTTMPAPQDRKSPARLLAEAVAEKLRLPYRDVMRADSSGPETRSIEPAVAAVIDEGDGALLVSDVVSSGLLERRCVKKLSAAGAHVSVVAWAAY
jgi:diguanylate cyclase (GGDEF)-like protein